MQVYDKRGLTPDTEAKARQEVHILTSASHPNVMNMLDTVETTSTLALVLEHCTHGDFVREIVLNRSTGTVMTVCSRLKQIIQAVLHIHRLVRLDTPLSNVLWALQQFLKLTHPQGTGDMSQLC